MPGELTEKIANKQDRAVIMHNYLDTLADSYLPVELFDLRLSTHRYAEPASRRGVSTNAT